MSNYNAMAKKSFYKQGAELQIVRIEGDKIYRVTGVVEDEYDERIVQPNSPLIEGPEAVSFMQAVMDAAYEYGLRPSRAADSEATNLHLKDMREIVRHQLKMDQPNA